MWKKLRNCLAYGWRRTGDLSLIAWLFPNVWAAVVSASFAAVTAFVGWATNLPPVLWIFLALLAGLMALIIAHIWLWLKEREAQLSPLRIIFDTSNPPQAGDAWVETASGDDVLPEECPDKLPAIAIRPKASGHLTIQTGSGADYDLRTSSQFGGILHIIRVKITNGTEGILTEARLSIVNLNPATAGHCDFPLAKSITLAAGESTYVNIASHPEGIEADQNLMCLQTLHTAGFFPPSGSGILIGEHRLQLRLTRNENILAEIYCRLYVDDHNVMRLEPLDVGF